MSVARPLPPESDDKTVDDAIRTYDARELIGNGVQARIVLDQKCYWLRITRAGKLILTK